MNLSIYALKGLPYQEYKQQTLKVLKTLRVNLKYRF